MATTKNLAIGGLFRCCIENWHVNADRLTDEEGERLECPHCHAQVILKDGAWRWDR